MDTYTAAMQKKGVVKVTIRTYVASYGKTDLLQFTSKYVTAVAEFAKVFPCKNFVLYTIITPAKIVI